jgi:phosphate transport system substrate-binding protein
MMIRKHMDFRRIAGLLLLAMLACACQKRIKLNEGKAPGADSLMGGYEESTTRGRIRIGIDESMAPVATQWVNSFENEYKDAHLEVWVKPERALMNDLLADSIRLAIVGRDWSPAEKSIIRKSSITPKMDVLGTDAVALVVHKDNPVQSISYAQLQGILRGEINQWSQLGAGLEGEISLVFDHEESGVIRYLQDQVYGQGAPLPKNAYAAGDHPKLFDYVAKSKNAIGFAGQPWLSDPDHPRVKGYFQQIKYLRIISPDTVDLPGVAVGPFPNEIALHRYPLHRGMYALSREHFTGLGTGFVVFAASERGQRILLKAGLLPEFMPPRYVIMTQKEVDSKN